MASLAYSFLPTPETFAVGPKYEMIKQVGYGAYGFVVSAIESKHKIPVAIKKISPFHNEVSCQRTLREIKFLSRFRHENLVAMLDIFTGGDNNEIRDIYIVFELMQSDMHDIIKTHEITPKHICYFVYQIFRGLKYIHSAKVIHRDLKPSNILVNSNCDIKICDFGLSRVCGNIDEMNNKLTEYVATRWYRAPEIMLNSCHYSFPSDVWSVGCIFVELFQKEPLFPGSNYLVQVELILRFLGTPTTEDMSFIRDEKTRAYLQSLSKYPRIDWQAHFINIPRSALELLEKTLEFNAEKRITAAEALTHPYFADYHDPNDEPDADSEFIYDPGLDRLPKQQLKCEIIKEIENTNKKLIFPPPNMDVLEFVNDGTHS